MAEFDAQKSEKLSIRDVADTQLDAAFLSEFEAFLEFLENEGISLKWKSINGYKAVYRGKTICTITLGAPGWLDDAIHRKNYIDIHISSAERGDEDRYLALQPGETAALFMGQISNKCAHYRPTCGCSKMSGRTVHLSGKQHNNVCMNALGYKFYASGDNMRQLVICSPCALYPPVEVRPLALGTVKNLIIARKKYIEM